LTSLTAADEDEVRDECFKRRNIPRVGVNDNSIGEAPARTGAGSVDKFRVEFTPSSADGRFGVFQIYIEGVPIGDGSTTALYPHYADLQRLCALVERPGVRERERLHLGDTFDHLELYWELTEARVVFAFMTRSEWGAPPSWAPPPGEWFRVSVARSSFVSTWGQAELQLRRILDRA
jgi:hypothetical protein